MRARFQCCPLAGSLVVRCDKAFFFLVFGGSLIINRLPFLLIYNYDIDLSIMTSCLLSFNETKLPKHFKTKLE